jgi:hypothetical protein
MRKLTLWLCLACVTALSAQVTVPTAHSQADRPNRVETVETVDTKSRVQAESARANPPPDFGAPPADLAVRARQMAQVPAHMPDSRPTPLLPAGGATGAAVAPNTRMGVNFANYFVNGSGPRAYAAMRAAGASYERITFNMNAISNMPAMYDWSAYDAVISDVKAVSMTVLGVLIAPSDYASVACAPGSTSIFRTPGNLDKPWNDPQNHWGQWVYTTVLRYKDTVRAWEMWNEPNFDVFWCGTPQQFAQMTRVTYQAIKAADPSAIAISAPIFRGYRIELIARFFEALRHLPDAAANEYYHDVIGFHLYDGGHCGVFDEIEYLNRDYFRPNVGDKPIWNTESGIRQREGAWPEFASPEEAANYLVSNYSYSLHKNVGRYFYWRAIDEGPIAKDADYDYAWGLLQYNGTPRPSYAAFQTAAQYLPQQFEWSVRRFGSQFSDNKPEGPVNRFTFYNTALGRVTVLYNLTGSTQTYTYTGILSTALAIAPNGSLQTLTPNAQGHHILALPASTNFRGREPGVCLTPGQPLILIESDTQPPTSTLATLPLSATGAITLTWVSTDTAGGSGVLWHDVQVRVDDGEWTVVRTDLVNTTQFAYTPMRGGKHSFRVRPRDRAGNVPDWDTLNVVNTTVMFKLNQRLYLPLAIR